MADSVSFHSCDSIEVVRFTPLNSIALTMQITQTVGVEVEEGYRYGNVSTELTLFRLPTDVCELLVEHFGENCDRRTPDALTAKIAELNEGIGSGVILGASESPARPRLTNAPGLVGVARPLNGDGFDYD